MNEAYSPLADWLAQLEQSDPAVWDWPDIVRTVDRLVSTNPLTGMSIDRILSSRSDYARTNNQRLEQIQPLLHELTTCTEQLMPPPGIESCVPRKLLGLIPLNDPQRDYMQIFAAAHARIRSLLFDLRAEQEQLKKKVIIQEHDIQQLNKALNQLERHGHFAQRLQNLIQSTDACTPKQILNDPIVTLLRWNEELAERHQMITQALAAASLIHDNHLTLAQHICTISEKSLNLLQTAVRVAATIGNWRKQLEKINSMRDDLEQIEKASRNNIKQQYPSSETGDKIDHLRSLFNEMRNTISLIQNDKKDPDYLA